MSYGDMDTTGRRTITAFFENRQDANEAMERLARAGIPRNSINIVEGAHRAGGASVARDDEGLGFWEALKDLFLPDEDRATYAEGLRRGGYIVTVQAASAHYEKAIDILDDEGTVDIDQRAQSWRQEGWTGSSWAGTGPAQASSTRESGVRASAATPPTSGMMGSTAARSGQATGREEVIPVTEEHLKVGKRDVSHGRVRVRSYVVETPVQEQVNLRDERVHVERRPVDRPASGDDTAFRERTIEAEERAEEAVISKDARVKEELVVKKEADQRTETISDKVRRTEVEVEDERAKAARSGERTKR
jgi:uncharacterized protein (TIGR02271 family)